MEYKTPFKTDTNNADALSRHPMQQVQGLVDESGDGSSRLESLSHPCAAVGLQAAYSTDDIREFQQQDHVIGQALNQ